MILDNNKEIKNVQIIRKFFYDEEYHKNYVESFRECINEKNKNTAAYFFPDIDDSFIKSNDFFYVARRFNSYTPALPLEKKIYVGKGNVKKYTGRKGGGYLLSWKEKLIAIDPGYNFIENIYYNENIRIKDIDCIIITHAHPDHVSDFENLLMLLYEYNDELKKKSNEKNESVQHHYIDIFMNLTASERFLNIIRSNGYIKTIKILNPGDSYFLENYNIELELIKNKHKDLDSDDFTIGLLINLYNNDEMILKFGLTSDTGWYEKLNEFYKKVNLLVAHVGGIKLKEIELDIVNNKLKDIYYKNHLGFLGTYNLISGIESKNIILSEFGEELVCTNPLNSIDNRIQLAEILTEILLTESIKKNIIPGDIGLKISLPDLTIKCTNCEKQINFENVIATTLTKSTEKGYHGIVYYCNSCFEKKTSCEIA